ncbi:hypothetical protein DJ030_12200 [bacterium endosymbiont of Escarpia laminata]|nr:MAG: hypothetical protein DJ030_12200 [bacterium endosymbiont of Escarpia laminata]
MLAMVDNRHGQSLEIASQLADHILGAASHQTLERGLTRNAVIEAARAGDSGRGGSGYEAEQ